VIELAAVAAGVAALLVFPSSPRLRTSRPLASRPAARPGRWRPVLCLLAGAGAGLFMGGPIGLAAAPVAAAAAWVALGRSEPSAVRRERDVVARELPHFVDLFGCALRAGASPHAALAAVVSACPGPTARRLDGALARLRMGVDPALVWGGLADDDVLATLGHTLARAESSGSSVADAVERLADELERSSLAAVEDRARAVGVKAALPLGLCLLPAFLLIGIVPTVAGLLSTLTP
jgi:pilus assembly protein TadC